MCSLCLLECAARMSLGGRGEWHVNYDALDHVILRIGTTSVYSIVFHNFVRILLLLCIIGFNPLDNMLKYGAQMMPLFLLL